MKKVRLLHLFILFCLPGLACGVFQTKDEEANATAIAASIFSTMTAEAPPAKPTETSKPAATNTSEPTATSTSTPEPTATAANEYSDEQMIIVLEKTERLDVLPEDFEQPPASEGNTYILFKLTVTRIKGVHITSIDRATLLVDTDQEYEVSFATFTGIRFTDIHDITSPSELVEGAEGYFAFEVPEESAPVRLTLIYSFKQDWIEETPVKGEIDIIL